jgi:hypothetical protein
MGIESLVSIAQQIANTQIAQVSEALEFLVAQFPGSPDDFMIAGQGEWLASDLVWSVRPHSTVKRLSNFLPPGSSEAAAAWAVSELATVRKDVAAIVVTSLESGGDA